MFSTRTSRSVALLACMILAGCGTDDPFAPESGVSAAVQQIPAGDSVLTVGQTMKVSTAGLPTSPKIRNGITYVSSDTTVATVDKNGLVLAKAPGRTIISARNRLGAIRFPLTVVQKPTTVIIDPALPDTLSARPDTTVPDVLMPPSVPDGTPPAYNAPMLPAASVNVAVPAVTGKTLRPASNNAAALQDALDSAVGGDEIVLPNGSVYTGNFLLPVHAGAARVTIRSETVSVPAGTRVTPGTSSNFATINTPNSDAALMTRDGAAGWSLIALRITLGSGAPLNYGMVRLGTGNETTLAQLPSNIVLDRVYMTAGTEGQTRRCVAFNGNALAVVNSWLAECHSKGFDTQGIGGWNGQGPYLIENNRIEGSGQAILFGGADPRITDVTPSDITVRNNYFFKPLSWGNGKWTVKAAFELKHARRVLYENNTIENHWADAQTGFAILLQALSDNNSAPWTKVQDVTIRNSVVKNSTGGVNLLSRVAYGANPLMPSEPSRRILITNVLFEEVGKDPFSGIAGRLMQLSHDHEDVTVLQNTFTLTNATASQFVILDGAPATRLTIANNVFPASEYGIFGSGKGEGRAAIDFFTVPGTANVSGNILPGRTESIYPAGNFFPASTAQVTFVSPSSGDFTLRDSPTTPQMYAGSRVGVDGARIITARAAAEK